MLDIQANNVTMATWSIRMDVKVIALLIILEVGIVLTQPLKLITWKVRALTVVETELKVQQSNVTMEALLQETVVMEVVL